MAASVQTPVEMNDLVKVDRACTGRVIIRQAFDLQDEVIDDLLKQDILFDDLYGK